MTCVKPSCGCECASGRRIYFDDDEVAEHCTSRCQCKLCGGDTGCTVFIVGALAKLRWLEERRKGQSPSSCTENDLVEVPILCEDCLHHAVPMSTQQALKEPRAREDEDEDDETNERKKKVKRNRGAHKSVHEADGSTH